MKNSKGKIKNGGGGRTVAALLLLIFHSAFLILNCPAAEQIKISALPRTNSISDGDLILVARITGGVSNTLAITKGNLLAGLGGGGGGTNLNFDSSQFAIINGTNVSIISGASLTNLLAKGTLSSLGPIYSGGLVVTNGVTNLVLTASRALVSDANKGLVSSTVTATELGYLSGVTSALQTQLAALASTANLNSASNFLQGQITGGGAAGAGTNSMFEYTLTNTVPAGTNSIFLDRPLAFTASSGSYMAIGVGTTNCEIRPLASVNGNQVSFAFIGGLTYSHPANEKVIITFGDSIPISWFGAKANSSTDDGWALLQGLYECGLNNVWLDGANASYYTTLPLVAAGQFPRLRNFQFIMLPGFPVYTNSYLITQQQPSGAGRYRFTADPATDVITTTTATLLTPAGFTNIIVAFYPDRGQTLPAPLIAGLHYYIFTNTTTAFAVKASPYDAAPINITSAGTGTNFIYTEVGSMGRFLIQDAWFSAGVLVTNRMNGMYASLAQPGYNNGFLRFDGFRGTAFRLTGQQFHCENLQFLNCGIGLDTRTILGTDPGMEFFYCNTFNSEDTTNNWLVGGLYNYVDGMHIERTLGPVSIDASQERSHLSIKHFIDSSIGNGTSLLFGNTNIVPAYRIEDATFGGAFNGTRIAINNQYANKIILCNNSTNGAYSYIGSQSFGPVPDSTTYSDFWSGDSKLFEAGGFYHLGGYYLNQPKLTLQAGTNQTANAIEIKNSSGTNTLTIGPNGALSIYKVANQRAGNTNLTAGTVLVANTTVTTNTIVLYSRKTAGGTLGNLTYTLTPASSFTINSDSGTDTSVISYLLLEVP